LAENRDEVLRIEDLSVCYGKITALSHVNLKIDEGEFVALVGANGAGKSTLLGTVLGINGASSGRIFFMGEDITHKPTDRIVASGICLLPEGHGILPSMTVWENLQLGAYHLKGSIKERLERVYARFPILEKREKQLAGTLSGGEQQMLSIARSLMTSPKLLMMDEPSLGLAPILVDETFDIILSLNKEGYTILLSEQNARRALQYSQRGYVFETGRIVFSGISQELAENPRVRHAYLGGAV
jgi:branched-chain amino acid transport system ATP-binding protein